MKFIADFHIHSHYSRATSQDLTFEHLHKWAQLKGVQVVGTGDLTHPGWLKEMRDKLEPAESGLFRLKDEFARAMQPDVFPACRQAVRFILSGEISTIYKKRDQVRKVHHVVFAPSFEVVEKIQARLEKIGNIRSDGRPILGLDSKLLLETLLEIDPQAYLIPAHVWTPWFSLFGSKSGFDAIEDCFEDLTPHIFALETGLSSDPAMNWRLSALDRFALVSNSDAHSPQKLAREANVFDVELSYDAMFDVLKHTDHQGFSGTIEFFPEEGKYHLDGHRKCDIAWEPETTLLHKGICPTCGKKVTVGVLHRVNALADRPVGAKPPNAAPFESLIPLPEILAETFETSAASKKVAQAHDALLVKLGSELSILREIPLEEIERVGGELLAEAIRRMRAGDVIADAGYDGEYGVIRLFRAGERAAFGQQSALIPVSVAEKKPRKSALLPDNASSPGQPCPDEAVRGTDSPQETPGILSGLNPEQREAALCVEQSLIIAAGPGTGKTRTLTHRMAHLIAEKQVASRELLAITFTNKAAEEMAQRLTRLLGETVTQQIIIKTFHAFCAMILRHDGERVGLNPNFVICAEHDREALLRRLFPAMKDKEISAYLEQISAAKNRLAAPDDEAAARIFEAYQAALREYQAVDFDDLIAKTIELFEAAPDALTAYQQRFRWIAVDEYQDVNFPQYRLLRLLKTPDTNLCAIGDPDQAIYGFRGADRSYFLQFQQDYPDAALLRLRQNYRSTQTILDASRQVIAKSAERLPLEIWSDFVSQTRLEIHHAPTYKAEAEFVVHEVEKMVGGTTYFSLDSGRVESHEDATRAFGDIAVLYRLNAQSAALIEAFDRSGIPFQVVGQTPLCAYKDMREILAYLWALANPDVRFHLDMLAKESKERALFLEELRKDAETLSVAELIQTISKRVAPAAADAKRADRLKRLIERAKPFERRLRDFLEFAALQKDADDYDPRADRVTLMTLHASKGLEFPVVFIVGCEEGVIPYQRDGEPRDIEEERRLFYVGITRAREKLLLTRAQMRFLFGKTREHAPSRFLNDIEDALKEVKKREQRKIENAKPVSPQLGLF
ncbi:UvrD/REP helicase [Candidatus Moduliflexus flocculans]|uniref:DNA 3'-5' helicase n=1 Tax=Candidatus Moduliflexus flocculans TaxID=1499966 RepID=A0A0S6VT13_9BACT|nr:UvrD/REP helicase [Candidatus Moduliflexus flocculans]